MPVNSNGRFQDNRPGVKFKVVGGEYDGEPFVEFKQTQPRVSVSTQANFAEHDVFGDVTVRQKLGEKPDEISIEGQCTADEATKIDQLVYREVVELVSSRWSGVVHIASTSTDPISDGGGMDLDGEWLYNFTVEAVEITETFNQVNGTDVEDLININNDTAQSESVGSVVVEAYPEGTTVSGTNVTFSGGMIQNTTGTEVEVFFEYRPTGTQQWTQTNSNTLSKTDSFQIEVRNLNERDDYDFRAVGIASVEGEATVDDYSGVDAITTGFGAHSSDGFNVKTVSATSDSVGSATFEGEVTKMVGAEKVECYFEYKKESDSTWQTSGYTTMLTEPSTFSETVDNLGGGTKTWEVRAVANLEEAVSDYNGNETNRGGKKTVIA